jgi:hypothetical protein
MLIVICGAGASYDSIWSRPPVSGGHDESRPPLMRDIFKQPIFELAATCFGITPANIERLRNCDFIEDQLEDLREENTPESKRQLMAIRWYLQVNIATCGRDWTSKEDRLNHNVLIDKIEANFKDGGPVCFVTFNYDLLIEHALKSRTTPVLFNNFNAYWNQSTYKLFKPHGSVNWSREITAPMFENFETQDQLKLALTVIDRAAEIEFGSLYNLQNEYVSTVERPIGWNGPMKNAMVPAIAIPATGKRGFVCPPEHVPQIRQCAVAATKVLIIGSQAREGHFFSLLAKNTRRLIIAVACGGRGEADRVVDRLKAYRIKADFLPTGDGFSNLVAGTSIEEFLRA